MTSRLFVQVIGLHLGLLGAVLCGPPLAAQSRAQSPKLYVFDCGTMLERNSERWNLKKEEVPSQDLVSACWLVVHPQGTLLYDAGLEPGPGMIAPARSLNRQLAQIGYTPEQITYFSLSHFHGDHTGRSNDFRSSTWLVQELEYAAMFPENPPATFNITAYKDLKDSKKILLHGDHDVFGDGTVVLKSTPGHTPGHQSLFIKLAKTGPIVLSGDLYHFPEELTLNRLPTFGFDLKQVSASRVALEAFMKKTGAQLWITHELKFNFTRMKAPNYYE